MSFGCTFPLNDFSASAMNFEDEFLLSTCSYRGQGGNVLKLICCLLILKCPYSSHRFNLGLGKKMGDQTISVGPEFIKIL